MNVDVKPWYQSLTNWTQIIGVLAVIGGLFGLNLDAATQAALATSVVTIVGVVTVILRTFFTKTVTPSVAKKL